MNSPLTAVTGSPGPTRAWFWHNQAAFQTGPRHYAEFADSSARGAGRPERNARDAVRTRRAGPEPAAAPGDPATSAEQDPGSDDEDAGPRRDATRQGARPTCCRQVQARAQSRDRRVLAVPARHHRPAVGARWRSGQGRREHRGLRGHRRPAGPVRRRSTCRRGASHPAEGGLPGRSLNGCHAPIPSGHRPSPGPEARYRAPAQLGRDHRGDPRARPAAARATTRPTARLRDRAERRRRVSGPCRTDARRPGFASAVAARSLGRRAAGYRHLPGSGARQARPSRHPRRSRGGQAARSEAAAATPTANPAAGPRPAARRRCDNQRALRAQIKLRSSSRRCGSGRPARSRRAAVDRARSLRQPGRSRHRVDCNWRAGSQRRRPRR